MIVCRNIFLFGFALSLYGCGGVDDSSEEAETSNSEAGAAETADRPSRSDESNAVSDDSQQLNEENVARALNEALSGISCQVVFFDIGAARSEGSLAGPYNISKSSGHPEVFQPLLNSGALEIIDDGATKVKVMIADQYLKYFRSSNTFMFSNSRYNGHLHMCGNDERVASIESFTIPGEGGSQTSRVKFYFRADDPVPFSWMSTKRSAPPEGGYAEAVLQLTNNGWETVSIDK